jgi:glycine cleavage system H protein
VRTLTDTNLPVDRSASVPADRRYTDIHSWLALRADQPLGDRPLRVGITGAAVEGIHIISVELPRAGVEMQASPVR